MTIQRGRGLGSNRGLVACFRRDREGSFGRALERRDRGKGEESRFGARELGRASWRRGGREAGAGLAFGLRRGTGGGGRGLYANHEASASEMYVIIRMTPASGEGEEGAGRQRPEQRRRGERNAGTAHTLDPVCAAVVEDPVDEQDGEHE